MRIKTLLWVFVLSVIAVHEAIAQSDSSFLQLLPPLFGEYGVTQNSSGADSAITLTQALQLVVAHSPLVHAAKAQIGAAQGRLQQSRTRRNPELSTQVEDLGRTGNAGPSQTTVGIEQPVELFGQRGARSAVAEAELSAEEYAAQESLLQLYRSVAVTFFAALGAQENIALAAHRLELSHKIEDAVQIKVNDGAAPKAELLRAQTAVKLAEIDVASANAEARQQRLALAAQWGASQADFVVSGDLKVWLSILPLDSQVPDLRDNPKLARLQDEILARKADVRLSKVSGKPDVRLGAGYRRLHDEGTNAFLVWANIPLPLFNRNQGGVAEANALVSQSESEYAAARQQLESELCGRLLSIETLRNQINLLQEQVIPPAEQALQEMDQAYRLGSQSYVAVLDAQQALSELQGQLLEASVKGAQAVAEIEELIGHRLNPVRN